MDKDGSRNLTNEIFNFATDQSFAVSHKNTEKVEVEIDVAILETEKIINKFWSEEKKKN